LAVLSEGAGLSDSGSFAPKEGTSALQVEPETVTCIIYVLHTGVGIWCDWGAFMLPYGLILDHRDLCQPRKGEGRNSLLSAPTFPKDDNENEVDRLIITLILGLFKEYFHELH
jgi:hypothetical protein